MFQLIGAVVTVSLGLVLSGSQISEEQPTAARHFEGLKTLEGKWEGSSTQGWTGHSEYRVIARGSTLMSTSQYEAHPRETMATMFYLDGNRLLLTHYCVSRTQPRLVADLSESTQGRIVFRFLDGTSMASRDIGHMDKAVLRFIDADTISWRWTWFQDGKETWMEEILYRRVFDTDSSDF